MIYSFSKHVINTKVEGLLGKNRRKLGETFKEINFDSAWMFSFPCEPVQLWDVQSGEWRILHHKLHTAAQAGPQNPWPDQWGARWKQELTAGSLVPFGGRIEGAGYDVKSDFKVSEHDALLSGPLTSGREPLLPSLSSKGLFRNGQSISPNIPGLW